MQSAGVAALTGRGSGPGEEGFSLPVLSGTLSHLLWVHAGCSVILELALHLNKCNMLSVSIRTGYVRLHLKVGLNQDQCKRFISLLVGCCRCDPVLIILWCLRCCTLRCAEDY